MSERTPTIGRLVHYVLTAGDAETVNRRRTHHRDHVIHGEGSVIYTGSDVHEGDVFPMVITRVDGNTPDTPVNGQVLLDGNDTLWVTSVQVGTEPGHFAWPSRA